MNNFNFLPTWLALKDLPELHNGTLVGKYLNNYKDMGSCVRIELEFGNTTYGGKGSWIFGDLPKNLKYADKGHLYLYKFGVEKIFDRSVVYDTARNQVLPFHNTWGIDFITPWMWGHGDRLAITLAAEPLMTRHTFTL